MKGKCTGGYLDGGNDSFVGKYAEGTQRLPVAAKDWGCPLCGDSCSQFHHGFKYINASTCTELGMLDTEDVPSFYWGMIGCSFPGDLRKSAAGLRQDP